jgi:hypothetical protein
MKDLLSLDELFDEAKMSLRQEARAKLLAEAKVTKVKRPSSERILPQALYTDPKNWVKGRGLALIHKETQTLLGNFIEWLHASVPDCRRLVREDSPISVSAIEEVTGDWGYKAPPQLDHTDSSIRTVELELFVKLYAPEVVSELIKLRVTMQGSGILRVELAEQSLFSDTASGGFLSLPAGTNILPVMSRESKTQLHEALK